MAGGTLTGGLTGTDAKFNNLSTNNLYINGVEVSTFNLKISPTKPDGITVQDAGSLILMEDNGSTNPQPLTLPDLTTSGLEDGFQVMIMQMGVNNLQFVPYDTDAILSEGNRKKTAGRYSIATIVKATTAWLLYGDLI